mgnify:CR=1 FL=1
MNAQNTNNAKDNAISKSAEALKAELIPAKDVNVLPVMDSASIIGALAKIEEFGDKARLYKCLLINTMIKYHGKDGKKAMVDRFGYTNDTINSYSLIADKFLHYELPQKKETVGERTKEVTDTTTMLSNINQCNGKIRGLRDKNGRGISFTVMYTVRNLTDDEIQTLIDSGEITYLTTQKVAQELCKKFKKNNTKNDKNGTGNAENADKPIKLSAMKKDSERFEMMIKIMNTLSDGIKDSDDFDTLAELLEKFKKDSAEAEATAEAQKNETENK